MKIQSSITSRQQDYSQWYNDVIKDAELVHQSSVRGCMVLKPNGYGIWENIQTSLDKIFKNLGVQNVYFPLFIPLNLLTKEAAHIKGFALECAVVTHHRLELDELSGKLIPTSKLEEPLIVRPTSETIMYDTYSQIIQSYRDLPLVWNQWANIVRWEMKTRPFLRTTEFLWQEGHTAHASKSEAEKMVWQMLQVYSNFCRDYLAIPVLSGIKSKSQTFPGADYTTCIEAMMQDGKALQMGTSHLLGQTFAKAFNIQYTTDRGNLDYVWQTSWGVSTRLIGGMIMVHSDDKGLVLPPKIATHQIVIIPLIDNDRKSEVLLKANQCNLNLTRSGIRVKVDDRDYIRPGVKFYEWEKKGIPIRLELGPKELDKNEVTYCIRHNGDKNTLGLEGLETKISGLLDRIHLELLANAIEYQKKHTLTISSFDEFKTQINGNFLRAHWCGSAECEELIKELTAATIRTIPKDSNTIPGQCVYCKEPSIGLMTFARSY